ncbi:T9SS type A sorting domain-containing protein [bacterium]|nr:T9SS type A sorting domain-containing protein [bacterium]
MFKKFLFAAFALLICAGYSFGGTVSGNIIFDGGDGAGFVLLLDSSLLEADSINPEDIPFAAFFSVGPWSVEHTFSDFLEYYAVAGMPASGLVPLPGEPCGQYPGNPFTTTGGDATGIDVVLDTIGGIVGEITYSGSFDNVKLNVYDAYPWIISLVGVGEDDLVLEDVHAISGNSFSFDDLTSGAKKFVLFVDENMNETLDLSEVRDTADSELRGVFFIGGGMGTDTVTFDLDAPGIDEKQTIPEFGIMKNFPNPFNAATRIVYYVGEPCDVDITVYDITGNKVCNLYEGKKAAGNHINTWNGRNSQGVDVAPGLYLCKLTVGGSSQVGKMLYLK